MREMARDPVAQALAENAANLGSAPADVAEAIEEIIYNRYGDEKNKDYRKLMQEVARKLKGAKNGPLRAAILSGAISAEEVVNSDAKKLEELAKTASASAQPTQRAPSKEASMPSTPVGVAPPVMSAGTPAEPSVGVSSLQEIPGPVVEGPTGDQPVSPELAGLSTSPPPVSVPPSIGDETPSFGNAASAPPSGPPLSGFSVPPMMSQETEAPIPSPESSLAPPPMGAPPVAAPPTDAPPASAPPVAAPPAFAPPVAAPPVGNATSAPGLIPPSPSGLGAPMSPFGAPPVAGFSPPGVAPLNSVPPPGVQPLGMPAPEVPPSPEKKRPPALDEVLGQSATQQPLLAPPIATQQPLAAPIQAPLQGLQQEIVEVATDGGARSKALEALRFARSQARKRREMGDTLGVPSPVRSLKKEVVVNEVENSPTIPPPATPGEAAREAAASRLKAERLADEVAELQKQLAEERAAASAREQALEDKAGRLEAERKQLEAKLLEGFTAAGDETQARLAESEAKVSLLTREAADAKVEFDELKGEVSKLRMEREEWHAERDRMRNEADRLTAEKAGVQAEADKLASEKALLEQETKEQVDKIQSLQGVKAQMEIDSNRNIEECRRLNSELKDQQDLLDREREESRARMNQQITDTSAPSVADASLQAEVENLRSRNADLSKQVESLVASAKETTVAACMEERSSTEQVERLQGAVQLMQSEVDHLKSENIDLRTQLEKSLPANTNGSSEEVYRLKDRIEELLKENATLQRTAVAIEASQDAVLIGQELDEVKGQLNKQTQEHRVAQQEILLLQGQLASVRTTFAEERTALMRKDAESEATLRLEVQKLQVHKDTLEATVDSLQKELQVVRRDRRSKVMGLIERGRAAVECPRVVSSIPSEGTGAVQSLAGVFELGSSSHRPDAPMALQSQAPVTSVASMFGSATPAVASNSAPPRESKISTSTEPASSVAGLFGAVPEREAVTSGVSACFAAEPPAQQQVEQAPTQPCREPVGGASQLFAGSSEATSNGVAGLFGGGSSSGATEQSGVAGLFSNPPAETFQTDAVEPQPANEATSNGVAGLFGGGSSSGATEQSGVAGLFSNPPAETFQTDVVEPHPANEATSNEVAGLFSGESSSGVTEQSGVAGLFSNPPAETFQTDVVEPQPANEASEMADVVEPQPANEDGVANAFGESAPHPLCEETAPTPSESVGVAGLFGESVPEVAADGVSGCFGATVAAPTDAFGSEPNAPEPIGVASSFGDTDPAVPPSPPALGVAAVGVAGLFGSCESPVPELGVASAFGNPEPQTDESNGVAGLFGNSDAIDNEPHVSTTLGDDNVGVTNCFGCSETPAPELSGVSSVFGQSEPQPSETSEVPGLFGSSEPPVPEPSGVSSVFGNSEPQPNEASGVAGLFGSAEPPALEPSGVSSVFGNSEFQTNESPGVAGFFGSPEPPAPEPSGVSSVFGNSEIQANESPGVAGLFGNPEPPAPEPSGVSSVFGNTEPTANETSGVAALFGSSALAPTPEVAPPPSNPFFSATPPAPSQAPSANDNFFSDWGVGGGATSATQATGVASLFG